LEEVALQIKLGGNSAILIFLVSRRIIFHPKFNRLEEARSVVRKIGGFLEDVIVVNQSVLGRKG
jgi:hypothetical protein